MGIIFSYKRITFLFLIFAYIFWIPIKGYSFSSLLIVYGAYFILSIILKFSTFVGSIGYLLQLLGKQNTALKFYEYAFTHKTKSTYALGGYGLYLLMEGNFEKAITIYKQLMLLSLSPDLAKVIQTNIGVCHWKLGHLDKAVEIMEEVRDNYLDTSGELLTTLGYVYFQKGDLEKARTYTNEALEKNEFLAAAYDNLGQFHLHVDELEEAKDCFLTALENNPHMVDSQYYLGTVYAQLGEADLAEKYLEQAQEGILTPLNTVTEEMIHQQLHMLKHTSADHR